MKRGRGGDLLLVLGELAALGLEGEDGSIHLRDLGFLHEDVPHLDFRVQRSLSKGAGVAMWSTE